MKGRGITEQILLAQEMIHVIDRPTRGGHVLIKLDMAKAFDRVCWTYLEKLMTTFGFHPRLVRLIINMAATRCSILINGKPAGFSAVSRGVKQGDPLSPLLFILASEGLSRGLNALMADGIIRGFQAGRVPRVSHLGFADDLVIFLNGSIRNMQLFRQFLDMYQQASRQLVNLQKVRWWWEQPFLGPEYHQTLGMRLTSSPIKYLGSFLYKGINHPAYCTSLINHFDAAFNAWSSKLLSMAGRVVLNRHVLCSILLYIISSSRLPKRRVDFLNRKMSQFFLEWLQSLEILG